MRQDRLFSDFEGEPTQFCLVKISWRQRRLPEETHIWQTLIACSAGNPRHPVHAVASSLEIQYQTPAYHGSR